MSEDPRDKRISELEETVAMGETIIAKQAKLIESMQRRLGLSSSNSSKPPSSDSPKTRKSRQEKNRDKRQRQSQGKRGAKPGHKAKFRPLVPPESLESVEDIFPQSCRGCHAELPRESESEPLRHQVIELPPVQVQVSEYRLHAVNCPCGQTTRAKLPKGISSGHFGPNLVAFVGLLTGVYHVSRRETVSFLGQWLGLKISLGGLSKVESRLSQALQEPVAEAITYSLEQDAKHVDATGWSNGGQARNLWTLATKLVTVFSIKTDGTRHALRELLRYAKGVLISDRAPQFGFWAMKERQICWAHLLRKFIDFSEHDGETGRLGDKLVFLTHALFSAIHRVREGTLNQGEFREFAQRLGPHIERLLAEGSRLGVRGVSKSCENILAHRDALWIFVDNKDVPPTNNHAEQEIRKFVLWRKKSFGSQSEHGERYAERVMTVAHTLRKQRRNVFQFFRQAMLSHLRAEPAPSLLPAVVIS